MVAGVDTTLGALTDYAAVNLKLTSINAAPTPPPITDFEMLMWVRAQLENSSENLVGVVDLDENDASTMVLSRTTRLRNNEFQDCETQPPGVEGLDDTTPDMEGLDDDMVV